LGLLRGISRGCDIVTWRLLRISIGAGFLDRKTLEWVRPIHPRRTSLSAHLLPPATAVTTSATVELSITRVPHVGRIQGRGAEAFIQLSLSWLRSLSRPSRTSKADVPKRASTPTRNSGDYKRYSGTVNHYGRHSI
jgi:hypothetical protein